MFEIFIIAMAGFSCSLIKTSVGIGSGLFILPMLSLVFPAKLALGISAPILFASDFLSLKYYWKEWVDTLTLKKLFWSSVPGLFVGAFILVIIPGEAFRLFLGLFGMLYALSELLPYAKIFKILHDFLHFITRRFEEQRIYILGFLGGFFAIIANSGGLLWSIYLYGEKYDKRIFVGTIVIMLFLTNIYKVTAYLYLGFLDVQTIIKILPAIPMIFVGSWFGNFLNLRLRGEILKVITLIMIFLISFKLCF